jgi:streptogramin lyase
VSGGGCLATKGAFMWFTTSSGIGRMAAGGTFTTFASPSGAAPSALCLGPDGHIWSDEGNAIARWVRGPQRSRLTTTHLSRGGRTDQSEGTPGADTRVACSPPGAPPIVNAGRQT